MSVCYRCKHYKPGEAALDVDCDMFVPKENALSGYMDPSKQRGGGSMIWKKRSLRVDAERWFGVKYDRKPGVNTQPIYNLDVGYFRDPEVDSETSCEHCEAVMGDHGWMDTLDGGRCVCPGDWIVTEVGGERRPYKPHEFEETHEPNMAYSTPALAEDFEKEAVALIKECGTEMRFKPVEGDEEIIG